MTDHIIKKLERIFDDALENEDYQVIQAFNRLGSMPKNYNEWYIKDLSYDYDYGQIKRYLKYIGYIPPRT